MITQDQRRKAEEFLALHDAPKLLILPIAWDVASARLYELEGFKAVATTSAGISSSLADQRGRRRAHAGAASARGDRRRSSHLRTATHAGDTCSDPQDGSGMGSRPEPIRP
ncbi:MAG: isocitrate lyase/phosphoenolpyruvate mutase family protein [Thermoleophilia bacterium]|nr:isocitrate lyase/phosphoenolpyruvate mutase family protein [Thermoleophilia bacterium]MDH4340799.1 isocitrate lyase/phosphoenolpyruvate mutase family protein [Thermoleophilia bacterium]MDH5280118.1 isocitrate lyase/phosphoenolpyruvate mutase family protein [Thermoleophilia bacterium]